MKKYIIFSFFMVILTSCSGSSRVKNITFFTPVLSAEEGAPAVKLSDISKSCAWEHGVNWVNNSVKHFEVSGLSDKFKSYKTANGIFIAPPLVVDGRLFLLSNTGYLTAYKADSNKKLWSVYLRNSLPKGIHYNQGAISYNDGRVYIADSTRNLTVVKADSGVVLSQYKMPDIIKIQPVVYKDTIFVVTVGNELFALDRNTGGIIWHNEGIAETLSISRDIAPIVYDGKVIVSYSSGQLLCLDAKNGNIIWEVNLSGDSTTIPGFIPTSLESQPILDGSNIYLAGANGRMLKLNVSNGAIEWEKSISDIHSMSKSGNSIFVTTNAMQVAAINDKTGSVVWAVDLLDKSLDNSKFFKSKKDKNPMVLLSPIAVNDLLFVGASNGKLYKLSPYSGKILDVIKIKKDARYLMVTDSLNFFNQTYRMVFK